MPHDVSTQEPYLLFKCLDTWLKCRHAGSNRSADDQSSYVLYQEHYDEFWQQSMGDLSLSDEAVQYLYSRVPDAKDPQPADSTGHEILKYLGIGRLLQDPSLRELSLESLVQETVDYMIALYKTDDIIARIAIYWVLHQRLKRHRAWLERYPNALKELQAWKERLTQVYRIRFKSIAQQIERHFADIEIFVGEDENEQLENFDFMPRNR